MPKPIVAVVGRPNVGKSTFFNHMAGYRISIIDDTPGVTRDRIYADCEWTGRHFTLIDTGGIDPYADDVLLSHMRQQTEVAMETADVILFMADGKEGLTGGGPGDRRHAPEGPKARVVLAVNKLDNPGRPLRPCMNSINWGWGSPCSFPPLTNGGWETCWMRWSAIFPEDMGQEEDRRGGSHPGGGGR